MRAAQQNRETLERCAGGHEPLRQEDTVKTSIRLYSTEFEIQLFLGPEISPLTSFIQSIQESLARVGIEQLAPLGGNAAFVVAFDRQGRREGWLLSDGGRPDGVREGLEAEILGSLVPPELTGGAIVIGVHYSFSSQEPSAQAEWAPAPAAWATAAEALGGTPDLGMVIRSILEHERPLNDLRPLVPLSDAMSHCLDAGTPDSFAAFVDQFEKSWVGAVVSPAQADRSYLQDASGNPIDLGMVTTPDGRELVILFADPWEFAPRYGLQFDALLPAEGILELLRVAPSHPGVVVSSATSERSLQITPDLLRDFAS